MEGFRTALILGGARSGKSRHAEMLALASATSVPVYIATAEPGDAEMAARIAEHRARRGPRWRVVEAPLDVAPELRRSGPGDVVLIDCLTLWLSNLLHAERDIASETAILCAALEATPAKVVAVANEVGLGIVPDNPLARRFRDEAGRLNQRVAAVADRVVFMVAGLPLVVKGG